MHRYIEAIGFKVLNPVAATLTGRGLPDFNGRVGRESGRTEQKREGDSQQPYFHRKAPSFGYAELSLLRRPQAGSSKEDVFDERSDCENDEDQDD